MYPVFPVFRDLLQDLEQFEHWATIGCDVNWMLGTCNLKYKYLFPMRLKLSISGKFVLISFTVLQNSEQNTCTIPARVKCFDCLRNFNNVTRATKGKKFILVFPLLPQKNQLFVDTVLNMWQILKLESWQKYFSSLSIYNFH